ncbi:hypothetical protein PoMZ_01070 [Pyricularia oryzae]|uniref:Uncharacterized protein n=1 Tax=Pyricularia oryzae TaxID=318829 RepID=A0A4P7N7V6_PYROR|nr:hypothetical protein PoMZ_01070 [Pyricularia oryzae]
MASDRSPFVAPLCTLFNDVNRRSFRAALWRHNELYGLSLAACQGSAEPTWVTGDDDLKANSPSVQIRQQALGIGCCAPDRSVF